MLLPAPNGTSNARPMQVPIMPVIRNGRRRPFAPRARSDNAPASGAMISAIKAPIARIEPLMPSFAAASGPRIDAIWSGTMTGTTVSQLANSANHSSDTAIWPDSGSRPVPARIAGCCCAGAAAAPDPSIMFPPPRDASAQDAPIPQRL